MMINWQQHWDYFYGNRVAIGAALTHVTTAGIKTAPAKWTWNAQDAYFWLYDWAHEVFNITNTRLATTPVPTPPVSPK